MNDAGAFGPAWIHLIIRDLAAGHRASHVGRCLCQKQRSMQITTLPASRSRSRQTGDDQCKYCWLCPAASSWQELAVQYDKSVPEVAVMTMFWGSGLQSHDSALNMTAVLAGDQCKYRHRL